MSRPRRKAELLQRSLSDVLVIATPEGRCLTVSGTGPAIWSLLDGERSVADIAALLAATYEADEALVRADVERFVGELIDWGALTMEVD